MFKKISVMVVFVCCSAMVFCEGSEGPAAEMTAAEAFKKLSVRMKKSKLKSKECEVLGFFDGRKERVDHEHEGCRYDFDLRNSTTVDLLDLKIECRFFYTEEKTWHASNTSAAKEVSKYRVKSHLKYHRCSFKSSLNARAKATLQTDPFMISSSSLQSGYYFLNDKPSKVETEAEGLWIKVTYTTPDGEKLARDFCAPKSLSSHVKWY